MTSGNLTRIDTQALQRALGRGFIGFDRILNAFDTQSASNYPPHNVYQKDDNNYAIEIAVAGFSLEEIDIEVSENKLIVAGNRVRDEDASYVYIHRGLALREFQQVFTLAEHIVVLDARITDGILTIDLQRQLPEALKSRKIGITSAK